MTKVLITKKDSHVIRVKVSGHALYEEHGKDIVCAGISVLVFSIANSFTLIDKDFEFIQNKDAIVIESSLKSSKTDLLYDTLINGLMMIEKEYPNNILIKEV